jgi:4-hydroxyacetophenone monooxygenase
LLGASDATIEDAVTYADPMVLRGILHQLTGDQSVADMEVALVSGGLFDVGTVTDPADLAMIRAKAAAMLKSHRDSGAGEMSSGPPERLRRSLSLTAGQEIPESDMGLWTEQLALDPWSRGLDWSAPHTWEPWSPVSRTSS